MSGPTSAAGPGVVTATAAGVASWPQPPAPGPAAPAVPFGLARARQAIAHATVQHRRWRYGDGHADALAATLSTVDEAIATLSVVRAALGPPPAWPLTAPTARSAPAELELDPPLGRLVTPAPRRDPALIDPTVHTGGNS